MKSHVHVLPTLMDHHVRVLPTKVISGNPPMSDVCYNCQKCHKSGNCFLKNGSGHEFGKNGELQLEMQNSKNCKSFKKK
jgi:hypothetical protein